MPSPEKLLNDLQTKLIWKSLDYSPMKLWFDFDSGHGCENAEQGTDLRGKMNKIEYGNVKRR